MSTNDASQLQVQRISSAWSLGLKDEILGSSPGRLAASAAILQYELQNLATERVKSQKYMLPFKIIKSNGHIVPHLCRGLIQG